MLDEKELLREAIGRNCGVVLSLPSAGLLRHHKSRFLADGPDGFWIESVPAESSLLTELIAAGTPAGLSFRSGVHKVMLASPILQRDPAYKLNGNASVEALLLAPPQQVKAIQRRANYRVPVHGSAQFKIRIWRIAAGIYLGDRPMAVQEVLAEMVDICIGGIGVTLRGRDGQGPKISTEDRLRIELTYGESSLLVEGRLRHPGLKPGKGPVRAGIQFKPLDADLPGRQKLAQLTRIIGELHRQEVRQTRRDIVATAGATAAAAGVLEAVK
jgi:hypothetical protein